MRALVLVCLFARVAGAAPTAITDDDLHFQIELPDGWTAADASELMTGKLLGSWVQGGRKLVVLRLRGNTDGAYEGKATFFAGLEDGVRKEAPDYHRLSGTVRKLGKKKKIPGYDLWYQSSGTTRAVRFIFLKNYCLMGTLDLPGAKSPPRDAKRLLESLAPSF